MEAKATNRLLPEDSISDSELSCIVLPPLLFERLGVKGRLAVSMPGLVK